MTRWKGQVEKAQAMAQEMVQKIVEEHKMQKKGEDAADENVIDVDDDQPAAKAQKTD